MKKVIIYMLAAVAVSGAGCDQRLDDLAPHNVVFEEQQFSTPAGYTKATVANYVNLSVPDYEKAWFNISEFRGNNVKFVDNPSDNADEALRQLDAFTYTNSESKDFGLSNMFWFSSYKALLGVNLVLKHVAEGETNPEILQAKAENLFLRAFINFNLLRVYGRPYYQDAAANPGIPLILKPVNLGETPPARSSVSESYAQIIADLQDAIADFRMTKSNSYASKYAAMALLSRVYLYMSGAKAQPDVANAKLAAQYADSVIVHGGYELLRDAAYAAYYTNGNVGNTETIWAMNHDVRINGIPALLMRGGGAYANSYFTGQVRPSPDLLSEMPVNDLRRNFYYNDPYPGNTTDPLASAKYAYGYLDGSGNGALYSNAPVHHLRLAEVYLNRAEARAKSGDDGGALRDLNVIHMRAGLTELTGLSGSALFDAILAERRLELAFEGHDSYDAFRNGLPVVRNYDSFNFAAITVNATDARVVMRISQDVLIENPNISQNKQ